MSENFKEITSFEEFFELKIKDAKKHCLENWNDFTRAGKAKVYLAKNQCPHCIAVEERFISTVELPENLKKSIDEDKQLKYACEPCNKKLFILASLGFKNEQRRQELLLELLKEKGELT